MSRSMRVLLALFCLLALLAPAAAGAERPAPPKRFYGPGSGTPALLPDQAWQAPAAGPAQPAAAPADQGALFNWSRIAFASARNGSWDIFSMRPDGTDVRPLTSGPASDDMPRQSPADGRIAFVSDRAGNWEIFSMAPDGSGLRQLTSDPADDTEPSWSPDGRRIAFSSNRGGNWNVWVMNADGTGLAAFAAGPEIDGGPVWSPDGLSIAWIRYSGNTGQIWVADASGANAHAVTGDLRYLQHLAWSPDGYRIGFDFDYNNDGWNDVASIWLTVLHPDPEFIYGPTRPNTDMLMGGYAPDGSSVVMAEVTYFEQNGVVYIDSSNLVRRAVEPLGAAVTIPGSVIDMSPDWQKTDFVAPVSGLNPVPRLASSMNGITLSWSGSDVGSGIARYELQYKRDGVNWETAYLPDPTVTSTPFTGQSGQTVSFRVHAIDNVGNRERWVASPDGEGQTTFYRERYVGRVFDNRQTGIPGVRILGSTNPDIPFLSGPDGRYDAYAFDGFYYLRASHPAYGPLPDVVAPGWNVTDRVDIALPPKTVAVTNGGFESGLAGWEQLGSSGVSVWNGTQHSGYAAVRLGIIYPPAAGTYGIRQQVQVPAASDKPTLSFFARTDPAGGSLALLRVTLTPEGGPAADLALNWSQGPIWSHAWADLSAWAGKTAVLTFAFQHPGGDNVPTIDVDEVSVGGWHMPRITSVTAPVGMTGSLTIKGENFEPGATVTVDVPLATTFVSSTELTAVLTPGAKPGLRGVWVKNPGGEEALAVVRFGLPTFLPLLGRGQ